MPEDYDREVVKLREALAPLIKSGAAGQRYEDADVYELTVAVQELLFALTGDDE